MTRDDKQGYAMFAIFVLVIVLAGCFGRYIIANADNRDPQTLCRIGESDPIIKVLVDKTDPWSNRGKQRLASLIRSFKNRLAVNERLSVFVIDETGTYSPSPLFDMCNPGRGDQANGMYQNQRRIQNQFEKQFAAPLDALLETLLEPGDAPSSPILETIAELRGNGDERLVLVSDMMQNSGLLSFYGAGVVKYKDNNTAMCTIPVPYQAIEVYAINRGKIPVKRRQQVRNFWTTCLKKATWNSTWRTL